MDDNSAAEGRAQERVDEVLDDAVMHERTAVEAILVAAGERRRVPHERPRGVQQVAGAERANEPALKIGGWPRDVSSHGHIVREAGGCKRSRKQVERQIEAPKGHVGTQEDVRRSSLRSPDASASGGRAGKPDGRSEQARCGGCKCFCCCRCCGCCCC